MKKKDSKHSMNSILKTMRRAKGGTIKLSAYSERW